MTIEMFDFAEVMPSQEELLKNAKVGNHETRYNDSCFICNRPMKTSGTEKGSWVHLSWESGMIMNIEQSETDEGFEQSQGYFPVGSDCAKKIPKRFVFKAAK